MHQSLEGKTVLALEITQLENGFAIEIRCGKTSYPLAFCAKNWLEVIDIIDALPWEG